MLTVFMWTLTQAQKLLLCIEYFTILLQGAINKAVQTWEVDEITPLDKKKNPPKLITAFFFLTYTRKQINP